MNIFWLLFINMALCIANMLLKRDKIKVVMLDMMGWMLNIIILTQLHDVSIYVVFITASIGFVSILYLKKILR